MRNKWKIGFFSLLGIDLLILIVILFLFLTPASEHDPSDGIAPSSEYVPFYVQTNKQNVNRLINYYLTKNAASSPVDYQVTLGNAVELDGKIPIFGEELNMKLTFEPEATKNGDLILKQKTISIGRVNLPIQYVLDFIGKTYNFPSGVEIQPNQKQIYIAMQKLKINNGIKVKAEKFDLKQNDIAFTILVPMK